ncbi:MAG: peptidoglycan-binding protein [Eubacteriales bacterium]|nr:peptidoglycan-binding protein [Eubacteriales bacterium]
MFCSKCGKTIPQGGRKCAHCGIEIADIEFASASYISSLPLPGQTPQESAAQARSRFTRTTYTTMPEENEDDVVRRTSYRPAYQEPEQPLAQQEEAAESAPEQEQSAPEAPPEQPVEADPSTLPEEMRVRPLRKVTLGGISPQMAEHMKRAEEEAAAASEKKLARPSVSGLFSSSARGTKTIVPKRKFFAKQEEEPAAEEYYEDAEQPAEEEAYDEAAYDEAAYDENEYYEEDEVFDTSDIEEEEPEEPGRQMFSFRRPSAPPSRSTVILRTAIIAVVVLALCAGGFIWLSLQTAAKSPITGVTHSLFEQSVAILEEHTTSSYKASMADLYAADPTGASLLTKQTEDQAKLLALVPGTPLANDADFISTVLSIQSSIDMAVTLDVMSGETLDRSASSARWNAIDNAIKRLKSTSDAMEFDAIAQAAVVNVTPTPAPTATPTPYSTLTKGMADNEDVRAMQNRLYELGWFTDVRDGDFGALTQTSIKQFQQAAGLSVTGIADPETLSAIYAEDAPRTGAKVTPAPTPAA